MKTLANMNDTEILLNEFRNQIDSIDREIIYLLSRRFNLVSSIWDVKKQNNIEALQPWRWNEVLEKLDESCNEFWVDSELVKNIWDLIHLHSLKIEK